MNRLSLVALLINFIIDCQADSITYPGIGTFTTDDFYHPLYRPVVLLPQSPEHIDPTFSLYTHQNINDGQRLAYNDTSSYHETNFDPTLKTKIVVHGFVDNELFGTWQEEMKSEFLKKDRYNVILVDWRKGNLFPYIQAASNTRVVGAMIGTLIKNLCEAFETKPNMFHVLGHSLGSHIAGYTGKFLQSKLGHITGLDPAGPLFEGIEPLGRLWHTDAEFVESIHTDARHLLPTVGFGMYETCSHVDIYPNGGKSQPGCNQERVTSFVIHGLVEGSRQLVACNHIRSIDFYIESINNARADPVAYQCDSYDRFLAGMCNDCGKDGSKCALLGPRSVEYSKHLHYDSKISENKRFFLKTASKKPFLKFQYYINITLDKTLENILSESGSIKLIFISNDKSKEEFDFKSNGDMSYLFDNNYFSELLVLNTDPNKLTGIMLVWSHGMVDMVVTSNMYVKYIDLIEFNQRMGTFHTRNSTSADRIRLIPKKYPIPSSVPVLFTFEMNQDT